jgi:hypothetical protein
MQHNAMTSKNSMAESTFFYHGGSFFGWAYQTMQNASKEHLLAAAAACR